MKLSHYILLVFVFVNSVALSQNIDGIVTDVNGAKVGYATIYIEELQTGTSANGNGEYSIIVDKKGTYTITFRALGYSPTVKKVVVNNENVALNVILEVQSYILAGVTVRADNEDPAYSIMRKSIARVPVFLHQVESYTSEVYIKAALRIDKIPKLLKLGMDGDAGEIKENHTYVNESINLVKFTAPDKYKQDVISVNNSFPIEEGRKVPVMWLITKSVYLSVDDFYISPFATNSFAHYKFQHEGMLQYGDLFVNKIKVIPKRKNKMLVSGYVYIIEDIWCVYSYDFTIHPPFSTIRAKQHFAPVKGNNYLPVNMFSTATFKTMGIKAVGTYTNTIKYKDIKINPKFANKKVTNNYLKIVNQSVENKKDKQVKQPPKAPRMAKKEKKKKELEKKILELAEKEELTNRDMSKLQRLMSQKASLDRADADTLLEIKSKYNIVRKKNDLVRDSVYWDSIRPIPVTKDERISYQKVEKKKVKQDSTSKFVKALNVAMFGNSEWGYRDKKVYFHYAGLLALRNAGFHPTSGLELSQTMSLRVALDTMASVLYLKGKGGYYLGRKEAFGKGSLEWQYNRLKRASSIFKGEYLLSDFNRERGADPTVNIFYNLLFKKNYIQTYHSTRFSLSHFTEVTNGLMSKVKVVWSEAKPVDNCTNFSLLYKDKDYELNIPENKTVNANHLLDKKEFSLNFSFKHTPKQHYRIYNKKIKYVLNSKYPTYGISYLTAIKLDSDYSKYHYLSAFVSQSFDIYTTSEFGYYVKAGWFSNNDDLHFSSFKHFNTMPEYFSVKYFSNAFALLNNYEYSTADKYAEVHLHYLNDFLLLKHLPILSNRMWQENLYLNTLFVEKHYPYYELGYSMSRILGMGEVGVFVGMKGSTFHQVGVRAVFELF